jgi:hypothetical protein
MNATLAKPSGSGFFGRIEIRLQSIAVDLQIEANFSELFQWLANL